MADRVNKPDETRKQTILFAQLIEILAQNAIIMLGSMPDPQGRQRPPDLNGAEMMIEMMSVLQKKTKGNLTKEEEKIISGTLYQLQAAFAEIASKSGEFGKARKATEAVESVSEDGFSGEMEEEPVLPSPTQNKGSTVSSQPTTKPQGIQPSAAQTTENKIKFAKKYT